MENTKVGMVLTTFKNILLLLTVVGPSLAFGIFETSSMAAGTFVISVMYICMYIIFWAYIRSCTTLAPWFVVMTFVTFCLYSLSSYSFATDGSFDLLRFWTSYLIFILYSFGAYSFVIFARRLSSDQADKYIKFVFYTLIISAFAGLFKLSPFFPETATKAVLFYSEPSHFALNFLPLLLYMAVQAHAGKKFLLLIGLFPLLLLLENLTLIVGFILIVCIVIRMRSLLLLLFPLTLLFFLPLQLTSLSYYTERLVLSTNSNNLSSLVYISGLERAYLNLTETIGFGVGFQQFGIVGSIGDSQDSIRALSGYDLNLYDGGWVASKFIGEFGIPGLICILLYLIYFIRSIKYLSFASVSDSSSRTNPLDIFFHSCFVMYAIDLFVRGTGYFSSSGFFFVASICWLFIKPLDPRWWRSYISSPSLKKIESN